MTRLVYAFLSASAFCGAAMTAEAQSQPVAWSPGYAGACGECDLSGKNLTGWNLTGGNYASARLEYAFMRGVQALSEDQMFLMSEPLMNMILMLGAAASLSLSKLP